MKEQLQKDFDNTIKNLTLSQRDIEIKKFLVSKKNLELLWNICQIPDFEKLFNDNYLLLLKNIYLILVENNYFIHKIDGYIYDINFLNLVVELT